MCPPSSSTFNVKITAPAARRANATANTSDFLTEADQDKVRPRKTMKKKGPQRSQSRNALPGSSLLGLGKTTSFKLLTILDRSRFTVSHTGSVRVLGGGPNPEAEIPAEEEAGGGGGGAAEGMVMGMEVGLEGGGRLDGMKGEGEAGIDARGGEGGCAAGRTEEGVEWREEWMRFSISSMSDWEVEWSGIVSLSDFKWDIFEIGGWI